MKKTFKFVGLILIAGSLLGIFQACGHPETTPLGSVEVTEYQGQPLSPISAVRPNAIRGPQDIDINTYRLRVDGLVTKPASYTYGEIVNGFPSYSKVVRITCVEQWSADILWEGVLVRDILSKVGVKPEAKIVIFQASDNDTTSLPIDYLNDNEIIMAYGMNGVDIPKDQGFPFQLVAESKWGYKWIKWITGMEVSDNTSYKGYWESLGFSNDGDVNKRSIEQ